jgi:hypothetical protein
LATLADADPGKKRWPVTGSLEVAQSRRPTLTGAANRSPLWGSSRLSADFRLSRLLPSNVQLTVLLCRARLSEWF